MRVTHFQDTASRKLNFASDKTQPVELEDALFLFVGIPGAPRQHHPLDADGHGHVTDEQVKNALMDRGSEQFAVACYQP